MHFSSIFERFFLFFARTKEFEGVNYAQIDREDQGAHVDTTFGTLAKMVIEKCRNFNDLDMSILHAFFVDFFNFLQEGKICGAWDGYHCTQ